MLLILVQTSIAMNDQLVEEAPWQRVARTVFDKWDPTTILDELEKDGMSKDERTQMTQTHRLDRIVPYYVARGETDQLCAKLTIIKSKQFPLSPVAQKTAFDYLYKQRPLSAENKPLLAQITTTLDLLNPAQIVDDIEKGETYSPEQIDLENRVNRTLETLVKLQDTSSLVRLITIIGQQNQQEETTIIPGKRVLDLAYQLLRDKEKESRLHKESLVKVFGAKRSDSDADENKED